MGDGGAPEPGPWSAAVVVVNFGSSQLIADNAGHMPLPPGVELIVVDCFSSDAERRRVDELCRQHGWTPVLLDTNAGFGGGTNAGAKIGLAHGAGVVIGLNPDARLPLHSLEALIQGAAAHPTSLISPRIQSSDGRPWFTGSDLYLDDGTIASTRHREARSGRPRHEWATGACFAMSAAMWRRVGGFDDDYFLYWEDVDLSRRVLDAGGELRMLEAVAIHDEGQTHADASRHDRAKSETYYYFNVRNRLLYAVKHLDDASVNRWLRATRRVSMEIVLQGGKWQFLRSLAPYRALWRGMRDGRRLVRDAARTTPQP